MALKHLNNAGIYGSKSTKLWDQTTVQNDFQSIATVVVPSGYNSNVITISNIPQNFTHLQLRLIGQTNRATYGLDDVYFRYNGDTGNNYTNHGFYGDGGSATAFAPYGTTTGPYLGGALGTTTGNNFGAVILDILDYTNYSKNRTIRAFGGQDTNGTISGYGGRIHLSSGLWMNTTNPINSITIVGVSGNFTQYTQAALYGIKAAS